VPLIEADQSAVDTPGRLAKSVLEPFRALRANLKHLTGIHKAKVIMICSAVKGEGKTTLAGNLAITFAMDGKKVLLIDADLRRAQVHHYFNVDRGEGLVDLLLGERRPEDVERQTPHEGLSIITAGSKSHNPAELLGTFRFDEVIEELRSRADLVIFDSPAFLPVSDSLTMAPKMDAVVMIVRTLWTPLKAARQTRNQLKRMGAKILGGILNGVSHQHGYYPYYYGYYGYYAYKYTYSYDEDPPRKASMRQFGLRFEGKMREAVSNARFAVPQKVSRFNRFARRIARRPMFWLLVVAITAVVGTRLYVESSSAGLINEFISPVEISKPSSPDGPAIRVEKNSPVGTSDLESSEPDYPENVKRDKTDSNHMLLDSVSVWLETMRTRNWPEMSRFYDSLDFSFPGGGYEEWTSVAGKNAMPFSENADLFLGDGNAKRLSGHYYTTRRVLYEVEEGDTLAYEVVMAWGKRNNSWKIIRQKIRKAPAL
jgi:capsular exopolysaccharide synthesis family protein